MLENPDFEQNYWPRTAIVVYRIANDSIRLLKWICYYDRSFYENNDFFDLMASILKCLKNEI